MNDAFKLITIHMTSKKGKAALGVAGLLLGLGAAAVLVKKASGSSGSGSGGGEAGTVSILVSRVEQSVSPGLNAALPNDVTITVSGKALQGVPNPTMVLAVEMASGTGAYTTVDVGSPAGVTGPVNLNQLYSRTALLTIPTLAADFPGSGGYGSFSIRGYLKLMNQFGSVEYRTDPVTVTLGIAPSGSISPVGTT